MTPEPPPSRKQQRRRQQWEKQRREWARETAQRFRTSHADGDPAGAAEACDALLAAHAETPALVSLPAELLAFAEAHGPPAERRRRVRQIALDQVTRAGQKAWYFLDDQVGPPLRLGDHDAAVDVVLRAVEVCGAVHTSWAIDRTPELAALREDARVREAFAVLAPAAVDARVERILGPRMRDLPIPADLRALTAAGILDRDEVTEWWWIEDDDAPPGQRWGERRARTNLPIASPVVRAVAAANRAVHRHAIWVARGVEETYGIGYWRHPDVPARFRDSPPVVFFLHDGGGYGLARPGETVAEVVVSLVADRVGRDVEEIAARFRAAGVPVEHREVGHFEGETPEQVWDRTYRAALESSD